ncbi:MAG: hypothetical protein ABEK36_05405, partial [Candidatus Aenigmatarchaeota archaeon]
GFTADLVGSNLVIDGVGSFEILEVLPQEHAVILDYTADEELDGLSFHIAAETFAIRDASVTAEASFSVDDLEVNARLGFLDVTLGGLGSGLDLVAQATVSLDKQDGSPSSTTFALEELLDASLFASVQVDFSLPTAQAVLHGAEVGLFGFTKHFDDIGFGLYIQSIDEIGTVVLGTPEAGFDYTSPDFASVTFEAGVDVADAGIVVVYPDLEGIFQLRDFGLQDLIQAVRDGLAALSDSL